ncbi:paeninodin family lasso peptide [Bacillus gobiensis]
MEKKMWKEPTLEILNMNQTMAGKGTVIIDIISEDDFDIKNPS